MALTRSSAPSTAPPALWRHCWAPPVPTQNWPVSSKMLSTDHSPLASAAVAVIGLNVDPVGPALWVARLRSGSPLLALVSASYLAWERLPVNTDGSKLGSEPMA